MTSRPAIWALGCAASVLLHLGAGVGLVAALQPQPIEDQPTPETRLNVDAQEVRRTQAVAQEPSADKAEARGADGVTLPTNAIAQSAAAPLDLSPKASEAQDLAALAETPQDMSGQAPTAPARAPAMRPINASQPAQDDVAAAPVKSNSLVSNLPNSAASKNALPTGSPLAAKPANVPLAPAQQPSLTAAALLKPEPDSPPSKPLQSAPTLPLAPDVTATKAVLAFPADGRIDPVSLAAFQSLTQPESANGTDVRDGLSAALSVPCARMQVTFDPDTTTLQLTGHVPDPQDRGPVLQALKAQMGANITVTDNLLVLPAPQCGALSGIASVGLPQSTDQITNPLIVGPDTHARAFRYVAGDPLVLDLSAPDYPAFVYVDYFDADGNVIHLSPNEQTPLRMVDAKSALQIGARNANEAGLFVTIGPPYGQEIAAAFAASVPLYAGLRPMVEPAAPYLAWLKTRVANARAQDPDFKGEWVYFFVTTAAD